MTRQSGQTQAEKQNAKVIKALRKRAAKADSVLAPCLRGYQSQIQGVSLPTMFLHNLTAPLLNAFDETRDSIIARFTEKWKGDIDKINSSVTNSLRRSAGTNYQALISYALATYLIEVDSHWHISHPVPREFQKALSITFAAGISTLENQETDDEDSSENSDSAAYTIQPDVDVLLRNASFSSNKNTPEPVVLLSVKTSLVDRAGMAARWKTYFDQATHPCVYQDKPECVYRRLGIQMDNSNRYEITHGIVTANIYKINFHDQRYQKGELSSGQTRSNTFMFDLKLSTRDDGIAETPSDWQQFEKIAAFLSSLSSKHKLPA